METNAPEDDISLVAAALGHDFAAFAPIIERYKDAIFGIALSRVGSFHDAEDIGQQVFIEAFERLGRLEKPERLGAWLRSMAIHRSIDWVRRAGKSVAFDAIAEPASDKPTPQTVLEQRELQERVVSALNTLPQAQRETVTLFYIGGHSRQEIARMQEVSEETIKSRLRTARSKLKKEMLDMVEETLTEGAPKEDFAARVFDLLSLYPSKAHWPYHSWDKIADELRQIGTPGIEGFIRAFSQPHARTRAWTVMMLEGSPPQNSELVIGLFKKGLQDSNKRVRRLSALALLRLDVDDERKRDEFIPLIANLLTDPSRNVRRVIADIVILGKYAAMFPFDKVAVAFEAEREKNIKDKLFLLMRLAE